MDIHLGAPTPPPQLTKEVPRQLTRSAHTQLTAASLFSVASLFFTIILHCFTGLNPRLNIALNAVLTLLWALSWSLLTWYMSPTLANVCDIAHWNEEVGIMVCRIYKALFTFTLTGL